MNKFQPKGGEVDMAVPLGLQLRASLEELELPIDYTDLETAILQSPVRNRLMAEESKNPIKLITNGSFWNISAKYRFDLLASEISTVASGLVFAIAHCHIYMRFSPRPEAKYLETTLGSRLFWYHLDAGFRLASSGWDRIALLLATAFDLEINERIKLRTVLQNLPNKYRSLVHDPNFRALKAFRDNQFLELDGSPPELGIRHETTHRLSLSGRFLSEYLEQYGKESKEQLRIPIDLYDTLLAHYHYYIDGVDQAIGLIGVAS
jgi:hypothetical protein